jgi:hypothetical protein
LSRGREKKKEKKKKKRKKVKETVNKLEDGISFEKSSSFSKQKKSRIVKPRMGRGIKRDGLVQARIESLVAASGGLKLTGLGNEKWEEKVWRGEQPY